MASVSFRSVPFTRLKASHVSHGMTGGGTTYFFYFLEVVIVSAEGSKVFSPFVEPVPINELRLFRGPAYSLDIRLRTSTSLSTSVSSKVCFRNFALRSIRPHCGQGAGPRVNIRSMHVSHLDYKCQLCRLRNARTVYDSIPG